MHRGEVPVVQLSGLRRRSSGVRLGRSPSAVIMAYRRVSEQATRDRRLARRLNHLAAEIPRTGSPM